MASNYRNALETYLKTLSITAERVLDVGGADNPIQSRVKEWNVQHCEIIDIDEATADWQVDMNHILSPDLDIEPAEIVFCLELMEYIFNPQQALTNLHYFTKPNGTLYITFPFTYPVHEPQDFDYLRYTRNGAIWLLKEAGFNIKRIIPRLMTKEGFEAYHKMMEMEKMHPAKYWDHHSELGIIVEAVKQ